ncbi:phosphatase PAP2 family protein [Actinoplanes sp. TBRC 11911]|uniref:phosphatase PAP2 family protein n=1 Tax=Actinoplanes sp. TBRC 11911 TaxID=2729386 RepID=UPI00145C8347|nr:phosphatase PAP2 family protein [Actinoplanes sp. TBRC 11911]NMO53558.1 phosphatase PAP2 family protein [Actinoplanes sp. TBRC 11911]
MAFGMREHGLGVRLAVATVGAVVLLVPFGVIAALVVAHAGWLRELDVSVAQTMHTYAVGHPGWVRFMSVWSIVFHPTVLRIAAAVLVGWLLRRGAWPVAAWVAVTFVASGLVGLLLKLLFERARPEWLDPVARAPGYAFPSGHAMTSALFAAVFLLVLLPLVRRGRPLLWAAAVLIPAVTGLSRVALGVHWTSDVVAGWLLGVAVVAVTAAAYLRGRRRAPSDIDARLVRQA